MTSWLELYRNGILTEIEISSKSMTVTTTFDDGRVETKTGDVYDVCAAKRALELDGFVEV